MSGHSPGPWRIRPDHDEYDVEHAHVDAADGTPVAFVEHGDDGGANADLIASAPTLAAENAQLRQQLESALTAEKAAYESLEGWRARLQTVEDEASDHNAAANDLTVRLNAAEAENKRLRKLIAGLPVEHHGTVATRAALHAPASPAATVQPCPLLLPHDCDRAVHADPVQPYPFINDERDRYLPRRPPTPPTGAREVEWMDEQLRCGGANCTNRNGCLCGE